MAAAPMSVRRASAVRLVAGLLALVAALAPASPASATTPEGWHAGALANDARYAAGVAPLAMDGYLSTVAQGWADEMAAGGFLAHNESLPWAMGGWWTCGENVGYGDSVDAVHGAWLNSPHHYRNIVDWGFTSIGVGVAYDGWGWVYVVQVFGG